MRGGVVAGRRTKCTPRITDKICEALRDGNFVKVACEYVGIGESTYYLWVERGREELERVAEDGRRSIRKSEEPYVEFMESVTHARAAAEVESVQRLRKAAAEDWRADAWFLEHSFPDRWGRRRQEVDITTDGEKLQPQVVVYMPDNGRRRGGEDE